MGHLGIARAFALIGLCLAAAAWIRPSGTAAAEGAASAPRTHVVRISRSAFSPASLTVNPGDTIEWRNEDVVPHTATGKAFDSGRLNAGQKWRFKARAQGSLPYICTYHPSMRGTITVK
ncbi:MAG: cupredoxin family copper-binding protein [Acidobacteriota bacterium]|nr:MAG: cupredoxin family copper-binding protein [Acidobacteriota bacterium]